MKVVSVHTGLEEERVVFRTKPLSGLTVALALVAAVIWLAMVPALFVDGWADPIDIGFFSGGLATVLCAASWLFIDRPRTRDISLWSTGGLFGVDDARFERQAGMAPSATQYLVPKKNAAGQLRKLRRYKVSYGEETLIDGLGSQADAEQISEWLTQTWASQQAP